ncbi:class II fructose-bisphosphatase [Lujinxingia vulgaris]|uniref:Fructose-1,6-bisphosphatase n=1 Tax=Lujinxingia vulgaris TaxID=2600176 RepID=A0A5C6X2L8_9DELT|nr:class II fructose-bisphosphatase [Lujinxingia vulgaris]TXD35993.1 class II fructose-bisphosphatase [Lujinxingia vulgaris]
MTPVDDRNLALELARVTEAAAIASARSMGQGDPTYSDQMAVSAMRAAFDAMHINGTVVIGEGERDEAPMLYIGEEVGCRAPHDPKMDIALDPLEGTNLCAYGRPGALALIAMAPQGCFLNAPDIYMKKIAAGPVARGAIDLDASPAENLHRLAELKGVRVEELTAMILDRPRHEEVIAAIRKTGARIRLIEDGDVDAAIATCRPDSGIDIMFGIGGAPEGVLAAAAMQCLGGEIQGRLMFYKDEERQRARRIMGDRDIEALLTMHDLAHGEIVFAATGVTNGSILKGVRFFAGGCETHSLVMRSKSGTVRTIEAMHDFERKPAYTLEGLHENMADCGKPRH